MKVETLVFLIFISLLQLPKVVKACNVHTSEDKKVTRVSQCLTNDENDLNIDGLFPETTSLNFRPNSSVIKRFPIKIFQKFPKIESLVINAVHLEVLKPGVFGAAGNLKILSLERNHLINLEEGTFNGAKALETLKLGKNNITLIDPAAFNGLENVKVLDLSRNDLHLLQENIFQGLTNLETIDLSFNHLESLPEHLFMSSENIKVIKLFKNQLKTFDIVLPNDRNFCYLNVDNNSINYFSLTFTQLTASNDDDTQKSCTIHGIHAANNEIDHFSITKDSTAVNLIALNANKLNDLTNVTQLTALTKLDISNNALLSEEALLNLKNIKHLEALTLQGLNLTKLDASIFSHLEDLSELDVSNNVLTEIDFDVFANGLSEFYKLNLANNQITTLDVKKLLEKFPNISYLNIKGNQLTRNEVDNIIAGLNGKSVTVIQ